MPGVHIAMSAVLLRQVVKVRAGLGRRVPLFSKQLEWLFYSRRLSQTLVVRNGFDVPGREFARKASSQQSKFITPHSGLIFGEV